MSKIKRKSATQSALNNPNKSKRFRQDTKDNTDAICKTTCFIRLTNNVPEGIICGDQEIMRKNSADFSQDQRNNPAIILVDLSVTINVFKLARSSTNPIFALLQDNGSVPFELNPPQKPFALAATPTSRPKRPKTAKILKLTPLPEDFEVRVQIIVFFSVLHYNKTRVLAIAKLKSLTFKMFKKNVCTKKFV